MAAFNSIQSEAGVYATESTAKVIILSLKNSQNMMWVPSLGKQNTTRTGRYSTETGGKLFRPAACNGDAIPILKKEV